MHSLTYGARRTRDSWRRWMASTLTSLRILNVRWSGFDLKPAKEFSGLTQSALIKAADRIAFQCTKNPMMGSRCLFTTRQGYIGLGPLNLQPDDQICVLFGSQVPLVLRKVDDHHVLVGECFVLGLMDGEAITRLEEGKEEQTTFDIR